MKKISLKELATLLATAKVHFTYTTKKNEVKQTTGTNASAFLPTGVTGSTFPDPHGNLSYYDLVEDGWRTVHGLSEITVGNQTVIPTNASTGYVSPSELVNLLSKKIVKFEYLTKRDGLRVAYGTLDATRLPKISSLNLPTSVAPNTDILYYDIEKDGIRNASHDTNTSFKVIEILDLPLKK